MRTFTALVLVILLACMAVTLHAQEDDVTETDEDLTCNLTAIRANIRDEPDVSSSAIGELLTGETLAVVGRTDAIEGRFWWELENGGWVASWVSTATGEDCEMLGSDVLPEAEATAEAESTEEATSDVIETSACATALTPRLQVGEEARVISGLPNNVRQEPTLEAKLIGQIWHGRTFTVLDGPVCADGLNWYEVQYAKNTGWTAEGNGFRYWVRPLELENQG